MTNTPNTAPVSKRLMSCKHCGITDSVFVPDSARVDKQRCLFCNKFYTAQNTNKDIYDE